MSHVEYPSPLTSGDTVQVVAPGFSMELVRPDIREYAVQNLGKLGLTVSYGRHIYEKDNCDSSPIASRVADIQEAFTDDSIQGVFTAIGGYNSNYLLDHIDWQAIQEHPKVFCGFSDVTALGNAMFARTGLVNYSGPHFSSLGQKYLDPYTTDYLKKAVFETTPYQLESSQSWTNDSWHNDQENRNYIPNSGPWVINPGEARGKAFGGNLSTLGLLQGTQYMPQQENAILFIEDTKFSNIHFFGRDIYSFLQAYQPGIAGIMIGRFRPESDVTRDQLQQLFDSIPGLKEVPIVANLDFGHTEPRATLPIGGDISILAHGDKDSTIIIG